MADGILPYEIQDLISTAMQDQYVYQTQLNNSKLSPIKDLITA